MKDIKPILTLLATLAFVLSPFFVEDFSGFSADQLPIPQINPPIQPAGYAFSIWGIIYIWLTISAIFGVSKRYKDNAWSRYRVALTLSVLVGAAWLPVALSSPEWATVLIWIMLVAAIFALLQVPKQDRWWLQAPVAIYSAWLTAASSVSIGIVGAGYGLVSAELAAYLGLSLAIVIAATIQFKKPHMKEYGVTIIWALLAIIVANIDKNIGVQLYAGAGMLIMLGLLIKKSKAENAM